MHHDEVYDPDTPCGGWKNNIYNQSAQLFDQNSKGYWLEEYECCGNDLCNIDVCDMCVGCVWRVILGNNHDENYIPASKRNTREECLEVAAEGLQSCGMSSDDIGGWMASDIDYFQKYCGRDNIKEQNAEADWKTACSNLTQYHIEEGVQLKKIQY